MKYKIFPQQLKGTISAPSSKSYSHRALICAALTNEEESTIHNFLYCQDTIATIKCLEALGVSIKCLPKDVIVKGRNKLIIQGKLDAFDSASTIRMLIPIISCFNDHYDFYGSKKLISRLNTDDLKSLGLNIIINKDHITINGSINDLKLKTDLTSQWVSGILFILPFKKINLIVDDYTNPYNLMTIAMQKLFNVSIDDKFNYIKGNYQGTTLTIDSDYSCLSNFVVMNYLGNKIEINDEKKCLIQGDAIIYQLIDKLKNDEKPVFMMDKNPDLVPILAFACALTKKTSTIVGLKRLLKKESNRKRSTYKILKRLGVNIKIEEDKFIINGSDYLKGGFTINSYYDHRLILALLAVSSKINKPFIIKNAEAISKSAPEFMNIFSSIGGKYDNKI